MEFAEVLAATLADPDEIWHSIQDRADGGSVFVRNYVGAWETGSAGREWFVVTFHEAPGGQGLWWGATAFPPGKRGRPSTQAAATAKGARVGHLVYRRK